MALATTYAAKSGLPWWGLFIALFFSWMFVPIIGTVSAVFSHKIGVILKARNNKAERDCWICTKLRKYGSSMISRQSSVLVMCLKSL